MNAFFKGAGTVLRKTWVWSLLLVLGSTLLVWFAGPLLAVDDYRFWQSPTARLLTISGLLLLWGLAMVVVGARRAVRSDQPEAHERHQRQALISDEVVYFMPSESDQQGALGPLASAPELFHMTDIFWNKVAVNIVPGNTGQNDKLCVMYGPFLDKGLTATALQLPAVPAPLINDTSSQLSFKQTVFDIAATYNQFFKSSVLGHLPMMNTALLDRDLNPSFLARPNEVIVLEKESGESAPPLFKPEIDTNFGTLKLVATASAYQANYLTDFTPPYSTARMVSTVTEQSFISSTITAQASRQCFVDLQSN